jgi:hypothetical protein
MINKCLMERLESLGHKLSPRKSSAIVFCGWDPGDPRQDEYKAYLKTWIVDTHDPAITKLETSGAFEKYSFDHTKVPEAIQGDE